MSKLWTPTKKLITRRSLLKTAGIAAPALLSHSSKAQFGGCLPAFCRNAGGGANCDPFWNNVILLMSFNGPLGSGAIPGQAAITDESPHLHGSVVTTFFSGVYTSASVLGYSTSLNFPGGGSRVYFGDDDDWNLSNRLWTMELWIRPAAPLAFGFIVGQWSNFAGDLGWIMTTDSTYDLSISTTGSNVIAQLASGSVFSGDTWFPIAQDFDGTTYRAYVGGAVVATSTSLNTFFNSTNFLDIGAGQLGANAFVGNMQEIRITANVARYAGAYTPTTVPFPRHGC